MGFPTHEVECELPRAASTKPKKKTKLVFILTPPTSESFISCELSHTRTLPVPCEPLLLHCCGREMARALSGEKVYLFVILSVCVSFVLSRGRARLRAENLLARPLAVRSVSLEGPTTNTTCSVGRCWTEECPGEFVQSEPKGSSRRMCQTQQISHHRGLQATQVPRRRETDGNKQTRRGGVPPRPSWRDALR